MSLFKKIVIGCVLFLLIVSMYNILSGNEGKWNDYNIRYDFVPRSYQTPSAPKEPKEPNVPKESKGELECKRIAERIFGFPFEKVRLSEFTNPVTGSPLELDCYNQYLGIAIEYNGKQHYEYTPFFHASKDAFRNQQYRDLMKQDMCKKNNIRLITVPYTVKVEDIEDYLRNEITN